MLIHPGNASSDFLALFARFPGVRLACYEDSHALSSFFNTTAMSAKNFNFTFVRGNDFFSLPALQSERYATLVCEENSTIVGVGALTTRDGFIRGRKTTIGYLQDLRISSHASPKARHSLYALFCEFVRLSPELQDFNACSVFLTAILDNNTAARAALSRKSFPLEYTRLATYTAHIWPKAPQLSKYLLLKNDFIEPNFNAVLDFYETQLGSLAYDLSIGDIERLRGHATPVTLQADGQIVAACLLVQTDAERRVNSQYTPLGWSIDSMGTYITAFRVQRSISGSRRGQLEKELLRKAIKHSRHLGGQFTGFIETENSLLEPITGLNQLKLSVPGSLYRVFHAEHTKLPNFHSAFLRPSHTSAFEWVMS